jgi:GTP-binding protein
MRREGFEFQVSCPKVIIKNIDGVDCEPYEYVQVDAPNDSIGSVIELMGVRKGIMKNLYSYQEHSRLIYEMPSRGLIGFNTDFMTATKGYGTLSHVFLDYRPSEGGIVGNRKLGVLVASATGKSNTYGIDQIEDRGTLFIGPGEDVYEGMIVGECNREDDLAVNVTKAKNLTNQRSSVKDFTIVLKRPRTLSLEESLNYINDDELVELTPKSIRLRKRILDTSNRKRFDAYNK